MATQVHIKIRNSDMIKRQLTYTLSNVCSVFQSFLRLLIPLKVITVVMKSKIKKNNDKKIFKINMVLLF